MANPPSKDEVKGIIRVIRSVAPEFKKVPSREIEDFIMIFYLLVGRRQYGAFWTLAMAYIICHKMKMQGLGDNTYGTIAESMRVASVGEGDVSVSYRIPNAAELGANAEFLNTIYGRMFLSIRYRAVDHTVYSGMG